MSKKKESRSQVRVREELKTQFGGWWIKIWGGPFQRAGLPDIIGCLKGRFIAFEVKTETGAISKLQIIVLKELDKAGATTGVITSYEDAEEILKVAGFRRRRITRRSR